MSLPVSVYCSFLVLFQSLPVSVSVPQSLFPSSPYVVVVELALIAVAIMEAQNAATMLLAIQELTLVPITENEQSSSSSSSCTSPSSSSSSYFFSLALLLLFVILLLLLLRFFFCFFFFLSSSSSSSSSSFSSSFCLHVAVLVGELAVTSALTRLEVALVAVRRDG